MAMTRKMLFVVFMLTTQH